MSKKSLFYLGLFFFILFLLSCSSPEKRASRVVQKFAEAVNNNNQDQLMKLRKKVIGYKADATLSIVRLLPEGSGSLKSELIFILDSIGDPAVDRMIQLLPFEDIAIQREIINALKYLNNPRAKVPLEEYAKTLDNTNPIIFETARTLSSLDSDYGFTILNEIFLSGDKQRRLEIANFYAEKQDRRTLPALLNSLQTERDGLIKMFVVQTLGNMNVENAVPLLEKFGLGDKYSYKVREAAAIALFKITNKSYRYRDENGRMSFPKRN